MEDKIDLALSKISKLNQKLMVRQGRTVFCTCCDRQVNFTYLTVVARVREHSATRSHMNNITLTRDQRFQELAEVLDEEEDNEDQEVPVHGDPLSQRSGSRGMRYAAERVRGKFVRKADSVPIQNELDPEVERAKLQPEFERDLVQAFLETGIPVHKLNMHPLRDFLQKWTGMKVPQYEEQQLDYGF
jgi:hypothetical protein